VTSVDILIGKSLPRVWAQLSPQRHRQFFIILGLMLASAMAEIISLGAVIPFLAAISEPHRIMDHPLVQQIFDVLGVNITPHAVLLAVTLVFASSAMAAGTVRMLLILANNKYASAICHDLSTKVYERTLYRPYIWHTSHNTSEVIAMTWKIQTIAYWVLLPLMRAIASVLIGSFIVAVLIVVNPVISLGAMVGFLMIYLAVSYSTRNIMRRCGKVVAQAETARIRSLREGLGGIRDVLLDGSQPIFVKRFSEIDDEYCKAKALSTFIGISPRYLIEAAGMVLIALLAYYFTTDENGLTAGLPLLGALALGAQRLLPLMQALYQGWANAATNAHVLDDVMTLLEAPALLDTNGQTKENLSFERQIVFQNVSFKYAANRRKVLRNVNLVIPKGSRVGFVGKTGSGKSTLADLLMGLLEPNEGTIQIDECRLQDTTRRTWQQHIAHVPQSIFLSDSTISENIAFGIEPANVQLDRVKAAAHQAQLSAFVESLPQGYDTRVGERGIQLSGGQRQRIGIARALYRRASVLVLDEATSALDTETEAAVMRTIKGLDTQLTIVTIAHRLSTVSFCDQLFALEGGHLSEIGSYEEAALSHSGNTTKHHLPDQKSLPVLDTKP
jgi:ABC-type multidrug transport system fused ATPase/permease subunit